MNSYFFMVSPFATFFSSCFWTSDQVIGCVEVPSYKDLTLEEQSHHMVTIQITHD